MTRLGVVSDTHGNIESTRAALCLLSAQEVAAVIHCGDIGSVEVVSLFSASPAHFVFGNVDSNEGELSQAIEAAGHTCHGRLGTLEIAGRKIAFLHSDDHDLFEQTIDSGDWDLVCYGHSHVPEQHRAGRTFVLNPGALHRARPRTIAIVDLENLSAVHLPVESA